MHRLIRRAALGLTLPLVVGAPALLAAPAHATGSTNVFVTLPVTIAYGQPVVASVELVNDTTEQPVTSGVVDIFVSRPGHEGGSFENLPVDATGHVTSPLLTQADTHPLDPTGGLSDVWTVTADYYAGTTDEGGSPDGSDSKTLTVTKAGSSLAVQPTATTLVADITGARPGGQQQNAVPASGLVDFKVNGALVGSINAVNGKATLNYALPPGAQSVTASYAGDTRYTAAAQSFVRHDPVLEGRVISELPKTKSGWYSTAVSVWFICKPQGSELVEDCPADVTLKKSGKNQGVTRTVHALDGGSATLTVGGIDIDRDKPVITVHGRSCSATDKLSGVKGRCHLHITGDTYRAVAVDKAGNVAVKHGKL